MYARASVQYPSYLCHLHVARFLLQSATTTVYSPGMGMCSRLRASIVHYSAKNSTSNVTSCSYCMNHILSSPHWDGINSLCLPPSRLLLLLLLDPSNHPKHIIDARDGTKDPALAGDHV